MSKWLSDKELDLFAESSNCIATKGSIIAQAREANRLRTELEKLIRKFEAEAQDKWRESGNKFARTTLANRLRKILASGK